MLLFVLFGLMAATSNACAGAETTERHTTTIAVERYGFMTNIVLLNPGLVLQKVKGRRYESGSGLLSLPRGITNGPVIGHIQRGTESNRHDRPQTRHSNR